MLPGTARQIEIFLAAAEDCHFKRTAARLGVSQPAVTKHIANLEKRLGKALFVRRKGDTPMLTEDGAAFRKKANAYRDRAGDMKNRPAHAGKAVVRLFGGPHLLEDCIRPNLGSFYANHPEALLECHPVKSAEEGVSLIRRGAADMVVFSVADPGAYAHAGAVRTFGATGMGVYAGPAFASCVNASPEEIGALPFVLPIEGSLVDVRIRELLKDSGVVCSNVYARTQYTDVMLGMVRQNRCAAVLMHSMVRDAEETGEVINLGLALPSVYRCLFQAEKPSPQTAPVAAFLTEILQAHHTLQTPKDSVRSMSQ